MTLSSLWKCVYAMHSPACTVSQQATTALLGSAALGARSFPNLPLCVTQSGRKRKSLFCNQWANTAAVHTAQPKISVRHIKRRDNGTATALLDYYVFQTYNSKQTHFLFLFVFYSIVECFNWRSRKVEIATEHVDCWYFLE